MAGINLLGWTGAAGSVMTTIYNVAIYVLILVIVSFIVFIIVKLKQYKYSATLFVEKEGNIIDIEYHKIRRINKKGGGYEWKIWQGDKLPSQLVKEFRGNKVILFRDREGNYLEPEVRLPNKIVLKASDRVYAAYEVEEAQKAYERKSKLEQLMPIFAWGSVIILNIIAWIIIGNILQKLTCGG